MKKQRAGGTRRPSRRPRSCRMRGKKRAAEEPERSRQAPLEVLPSERIHEGVLSDLGEGRTDQVLIEVEEPGGSCGALQSRGFISAVRGARSAIRRTRRCPLTGIASARPLSLTWSVAQSF